MRTANQALETTEANRHASAIMVAALIADGKVSRAATSILEDLDAAIGKTARRGTTLSIGKVADRALAEEVHDLLHRLGYGVGMSCSTQWGNEIWTITW